MCLAYDNFRLREIFCVTCPDLRRAPFHYESIIQGAKIRRGVLQHQNRLNVLGRLDLQYFRSHPHYIKITHASRTLLFPTPPPAPNSFHCSGEGNQVVLAVTRVVPE